MSQSITLDYYGMSGTGRTLTEAKKDAGAKIKTALDGYYTPTVLTHRGYAILVYREPNGWCFRIIADPKEGIREGKVWGSPNDKTEKDATAAANRHLADIGMTETDTEAPAFLNNADRSEFLYKLEFLKRYRKAQRAGLTDFEAHSYAGRNPARPDLQARVPETEAVAV